MPNATNKPCLLWLRRDLRVADNPALDAALRRGGPVLPVFVWAPEEEGEWPPGAATKVWLHHSLAALDADLKSRGSRLVLRRGPSFEALLALLDETGAEAVYWNRRYEPAVIARDTRIKELLRESGYTAESCKGNLLVEPQEVQNKSGAPYQVFTSFWKQAQQIAVPEPNAEPDAIPSPAAWPESVALGDLDLLPALNWAGGIREAWTPGAAGAQDQLQRFMDEAMHDYKLDHDRVDRPGTSRLSSHLYFGEISVRTVYHAIQHYIANEDRSGLITGAEAYLRQLYWREFAHHLLFHFPHTTHEPLREQFKAFPWRSDTKTLEAWQRGQTGYPMVDAGMRELWATGWTHNRARMTVASFLVKHLLLPWQAGARWFWDTLVDADLANNSMNWQWSAGCGADAAPYFRVFNPVLQGRKFDPEGDYVRRWVPEIAGLPDAYVHAPWEAPMEDLRAAGILLGETYPKPIVDHAAARERALAAYQEIKQ
jgi:deoxyribodipyrimidine photo-lyase